jgi:2-oxoisovalerate dehydrogenase E1 component beta subunit
MFKSDLSEQQVRATGRGTIMNLVQALRQALDEELERDQNVLVFGEDVGAAGGVFLATEHLHAKYGNQRVFNTPLSEAGIVGMAVGMAVYGLRPVAEIQFADYMFPGFDQIVSQAAKLRYRSGGQFSVPMVIRAPCGGGVHGGLWHSQSPEVYFTHTPGLKVVMPSTPNDARGLLKSAIRDDDPVIFLEPKRLYRAAREEINLELEGLVPIGQAIIRRTGNDLTLVSYGGMMRETLEAASQLEQTGISVEVIDLRSLVPWDVTNVLESAAKTGRALVINEAPQTSGFAGEIAQTITETIMDQLLGPVLRVSGWDTPYPFGLETAYLPSVARIVQTAQRILEYR